MSRSQGLRNTLFIIERDVKLYVSFRRSEAIDCNINTRQGRLPGSARSYSAHRHATSHAAEERFWRALTSARLRPPSSIDMYNNDGGQ